MASDFDILYADLDVEGGNNEEPEIPDEPSAEEITSSLPESVKQLILNLYAEKKERIQELLTVKRNMVSLLKTAHREIARKNDQIKQLTEQLKFSRNRTFRHPAHENPPSVRENNIEQTQTFSQNRSLYPQPENDSQVAPSVQAPLLSPQQYHALEPEILISDERCSKDASLHRSPSRENSSSRQMNGFPHKSDRSTSPHHSSHRKSGSVHTSKDKVDKDRSRSRHKSKSRTSERKSRHRSRERLYDNRRSHHHSKHRNDNCRHRHNSDYYHKRYHSKRHFRPPNDLRNHGRFLYRTSVSRCPSVSHLVRKKELLEMELRKMDRPRSRSKTKHTTSTHPIKSEGTSEHDCRLTDAPEDGQNQLAADSISQCNRLPNAQVAHLQSLQSVKSKQVSPVKPGIMEPNRQAPETVTTSTLDSGAFKKPLQLPEKKFSSPGLYAKSPMKPNQPGPSRSFVSHATPLKFSSYGGMLVPVLSPISATPEPVRERLNEAYPNKISPVPLLTGHRNLESAGGHSDTFKANKSPSPACSSLTNRDPGSVKNSPINKLAKDAVMNGQHKGQSSNGDHPSSAKNSPVDKLTKDAIMNGQHRGQVSCNSGDQQSSAKNSLVNKLTKDAIINGQHDGQLSGNAGDRPSSHSPANKQANDTFRNGKQQLSCSAGDRYLPKNSPTSMKDKIVNGKRKDQLSHNDGDLNLPKSFPANKIEKDTIQKGQVTGQLSRNTGNPNFPPNKLAKDMLVNGQHKDQLSRNTGNPNLPAGKLAKDVLVNGQHKDQLSRNAVPETQFNNVHISPNKCSPVNKPSPSNLVENRPLANKGNLKRRKINAIKQPPMNVYMARRMKQLNMVPCAEDLQYEKQMENGKTEMSCQTLSSGDAEKRVDDIVEKRMPSLFSPPKQNPNTTMNKRKLNDNPPESAKRARTSPASKTIEYQGITEVFGPDTSTNVSGNCGMTDKPAKPGNEIADASSLNSSTDSVIFVPSQTHIIVDSSLSDSSVTLDKENSTSNANVEPRGQNSVRLQVCDSEQGQFKKRKRRAFVLKS